MSDHNDIVRSWVPVAALAAVLAVAALLGRNQAPPAHDTHDARAVAQQPAPPVESMSGYMVAVG